MLLTWEHLSALALKVAQELVRLIEELGPARPEHHERALREKRRSRLPLFSNDSQRMGKINELFHIINSAKKERRYIGAFFLKGVPY